MVICSVVLWNTPQAISQTISYYDTGEEFSGPLPSWKNIKTDFGAKGDGITDDAPAITAALYAFREMDSLDYSVLYFPAGTFRLGTTIYNADRAAGGIHYGGLGIVGEDPSNTILLWDGPDNGDMFRLDGWYLKISRLTFDGRNRAQTGLLREGGFGTGVEYSDLVFKDLIWGVNLGGDLLVGQSENLFLRCKFINCECGIYGPSMNSLDIWLWYCLFQDCGFGVHCGGYQAYENVFLRSKVVDIGLSWQACCIVNNFSANSELFQKEFTSNVVLFQGNKIYDPDTTIIWDWELVDTIKAFKTPHNSVLLDNVIKTAGNSGTAVELSSGKCISIGNTFTQLWPVRPEYKRFARHSFREDIYKAIDGYKDTYYFSTMGNDISGITWNCPEDKARIAVEYSLTAGYDPNAFLKSFRLIGSNDWGYHVTVLDSQINQSWSNSETKTFTFHNTTPFTMYRLEVLENNLGYGPGSGGYITIAEFSLLDTTGTNIITDREGFIAGGDETWGKYYPLHDKIVPYDSIHIPEIIELPGTPPLVSRRIFEIRQDTPDDAEEIQINIDSAAALPPGSRPIVHIPKGKYSINRTIILPANVDMTLSGDGIYNGGTLLDRDPDLSGPTLRILSPSHVLIRDIEFWGNEAIYAEVDDRPGSRVTGALLFCGGIPWWIEMANTVMVIDGIENTNMLFSGLNLTNCYNGVLVKGGPILSSGGSTNGQIAFLSGVTATGQNLWETRDNGKMIAQGMWYEAPPFHTHASSLISLTEASSGSMVISGMSWYFAPNSGLPIVATDNFKGQFTTLANNFGSDTTVWWQITGSGGQEWILSACNNWGTGWGFILDSLAILNQWPYWVDLSSPPANASRIFCDVPDITNNVMNTLPDSASLLSSLELLRSLRIEKPTPPETNGSHLDFVRIAAYCPTGGTAIRFIASPDPYGRPESPKLIYPINRSTDVTTTPDMNWNALTSATSYRLQVSENETFNLIVFDDSTISAINQKIGPLNTNTVYYWRVLAKNENGCSMWSPVWSFTTGTSTSSDQITIEIPAESCLDDNYPNPFNNSTSIVYSIPGKAKVALTIYDALGKEIETLVNQEQTAGKYEVKFDGSNLPGGIYFYKLHAGQYSETRKMVLIK